MIISPRYEFVFVHIPKCAGTSARQQLRGEIEAGLAVGQLSAVAEVLRPELAAS